MSMRVRSLLVAWAVVLTPQMTLAQSIDTVAALVPAPLG